MVERADGAEGEDGADLGVVGVGGGGEGEGGHRSLRVAEVVEALLPRHPQDKVDHRGQIVGGHLVPASRPSNREQHWVLGSHLKAQKSSGSR